MWKKQFPLMAFVLKYTIWIWYAFTMLDRNNKNLNFYKIISASWNNFWDLGSQDSPLFERLLLKRVFQFSKQTPLDNLAFSSALNGSGSPYQIWFSISNYLKNTYFVMMRTSSNKTTLIFLCVLNKIWFTTSLLWSCALSYFKRQERSLWCCVCSNLGTTNI